MRIGVRRGTAPPAAELVLLQVVGGVNEEDAGRELGVVRIQSLRKAQRWPGTYVVMARVNTMSFPAKRVTLLAFCHRFSYLVTLSALASTLGGVVRPICLAACRLMTNSNLVGCSMGSSPGLAPFKIYQYGCIARSRVSDWLGPYDIRPPSSTYDEFSYITGNRFFVANSNSCLRLLVTNGSVITNSASGRVRIISKKALAKS